MQMTIHYNPTLVVLSVLVAIFASYVALNLAHSVSSSTGRAQAAWLAGGAVAMGTGIWSMHFIGMLASEMPGMEMAYDVPLMVLSIAVAIAASALALYIISRPIVPIGSLISGGVAMAAAIAGMHYIGMYSMRMDASIVWNVYLVILSVVVALVASFGALFISRRFRDNSDRFAQMSIAASLMGFAIAGMHYTGMIAATFVHSHGSAIAPDHLLVSSGLTIAVVSGTLVILGLALAGSVGQRLLSQRRRIAEETLSKSEARFKALIEAVKDYAIFMLDTEGNISTWNMGAERITGYPSDTVIGRHVSMFYTADELKNRPTSVELYAARTMGHFEAEAQRVRKNGSTFWANIVIAPLYDADKSLVGYSKVIRDVTELREAATRLRKMNEELEKRVESRTLEIQHRETQLRMIANALPVLVGQVDRDERVLFANDSLSEWYGRTPAQMTGSSLKEILGVNYEESRLYIEIALAGKSATYERLSHSGRRSAVLNITYVPEIGDNGEVLGFILVASDVSKYKEIEVELNAAKEAAEVASETKSAFLANMSHEIRTPLGAVLGFSELMLNQDMTNAERVNSIEVIKRNGRLLSNIINDILDLSKVEAGKLEIEKVNLPISEVMGEISSLLSLEAVEKGIKLSVEAEGLLPTFVKTDSLRLRQVLLNIVGNAIKFTQRGSVEVKVKLLQTGSEPKKLAFVIRDTGEGIPSEQAEKLFSPFTQADVSTTRRFGGTGLGLVLSKRLASALGGDVILSESVPGKGSTFIVTIDPGQSELIEYREHDVNEPLVSRTPKVVREVDLSRLKVLIVDDSPDNQALITKLLRLAGASVKTASNGRLGVEMATSEDFSLILMDLQMPEMDGYEATRLLRENGYDKPIIALTAHAMKEERKKCLESGFSEHLTKPIDRTLLLNALAQFSA